MISLPPESRHRGEPLSDDDYRDLLQRLIPERVRLQTRPYEIRPSLVLAYWIAWGLVFGAIEFVRWISGTV